MSSDRDFRLLLLEIEDDLTEADQKRFVFLLREFIPRRRQNEPLVDIFDLLIERGHVSAENCSFLVDIFEDLKLSRVSYKIARYIASRSPPEPLPQLFEVSQPLETNLSNSSLTEQELVSAANGEDDRIRIFSPETNEETNVEIPLEPKNIDLNTFEKDFWSDEFLEKHQIYLRPYEYQRELVQSAIAVGNTIICLQTGTGKTFVAGLLLKYYLMKKITTSNEERKKFLAFFLVSRRAFLKQERERLAQVGNLRLAVCDENSDVKQYTDKADVILCTPQKLLNCLKFKGISLADIDVLCFNECHDPFVHNQYAEIMQYVLCQGIGSIPSINSSPIIIGLTGTLGFGGSDVRVIINKLVNLCAMLNCSTITTVSNSENQIELERKVTHSFEVEICSVDKDKSFDSLTSTMEKDLQNLIFQLFFHKDTNPSRCFPQKDLNEKNYSQELELLRQSMQKKQDFSSVLLLTYVLAIYRHSKSFSDLTPEIVLTNLRDFFNKIYQIRQHHMEVDTLIYNKCQSLINEKLISLQQTLSNPKLDRLIQLVKNHLDKTNNRALILVEKSFYAEKISEFLRDHPDLKNTVRPCWLVSQTSVDSIKANPKEEIVLRDFRTGVHNIMISTDVLQVGFDIPECSLVIRYEFVPDGIGTVQSRIRAQVRDCKFCLVTTRGSFNYLKELDNQKHEREMTKALENWKQVPHEVFKDQVIDRQISLINEWKEKLIKSLEKCSTSALKGDVLCRSCGYFLGPLEKLCRYNNFYFINENDFYNRIEEEKSVEPEVFRNTTIIGKALCGHKACRNKLGRIQIVKDFPKLTLIYPLKCESIKIKRIDSTDENEKILLKKQWKQMPFVIPSIDSQLSDDEELFYDCFEQFNELQ